MTPTYAPGEELLVVRRWRPIRPGDVVVVPDPRDASRLLLKRCMARHWSGLELRGDNPEFSTDSRDFGLVPARRVRYIVPGGREK
jgi:phage repressor protein C with HTH and peptisase S24 domain